MSIENFNIDSLLDGTLDDLADLPEFKPFPVGTHRVTIKLEQKVVNKHPGFELKMKALETVELPSGSSESPVNAGQECNILYLLDNEIGQGQFKKLLASFAQSFGAKKNSELISNAQNSECLVVTKQRQNKDKTQTYTDIVELQVI